MEDLLKLARRPAVTIGPDASVRELARLLVAERAGAAAVLDGGALTGIVSERDVLGRCVAIGRDPERTRVSEIMTAEVHTTRGMARMSDASELMLAGHFRHLPVVDATGRVVGMLSLRHLLELQLARLDLENVDLRTYLSADGAGG